MTDRQKAMADFLGVVLGMIAGVLLFLLTSCKSHERLIVETRSDTIYQSRIFRDSIYKHDSPYVREYMRGDTVYVDKDRWHTLYKEFKLTDTLYVSKKEYIRYTVKESLSWWQKLMAMYAQYIIGLLLIVLACVYVYYKVMHKREAYDKERDI